MSASQAFRFHTVKSRMAQYLSVNLPASQGVGLDGIHPSSIDTWTAPRRAQLVEETSTRLRAGSYRFTSYREGLASRGRGRDPRVFAVPTIRDRLALLVLKKTLAEVYGYSGPEPPQRKIDRVDAAVKSGSYSHYLKVDVRDYYGSVRHQVLMTRLAAQIKTPVIHDLVERALRNSVVAFGQKSTGLTSSPDGLPLGLSISPLLAELYLADFDDSYARVGKYFRYVDDVLLLLPRPTSPFSAVAADLARLGLSTHVMGTRGKCEFGKIDEGFEYLGYRLNGTYIEVADAGVRKVESQLASLISRAGRLTRGPHSRNELDRLLWRLNLLIGGCVIEGKARGWIRYYNKMDSVTVLGHLDALVEDLLLRYGVTRPPQLKKFRTAYWASRENERFRRYAFDLDATTPSQSRDHLIKHEAWDRRAVAALSDSQAQTVFRRLIRRHIIDLERDLEPAS